MADPVCDNDNVGFLGRLVQAHVRERDIERLQDVQEQLVVGHTHKENVTRHHLFVMLFIKSNLLYILAKYCAFLGHL